MPRRSYWFLLTHAMYFGAMVLNGFAALSLPYSPRFIDINTYVAQIQFNEKYFNGSLNGIPVQNLITLNVSLATFC